MSVLRVRIGQECISRSPAVHSSAVRGDHCKPVLPAYRRMILEMEPCMTDLTLLPITRLSAMLDTGEIDAAGLTRACLAPATGPARGLKPK
jgi:hypothetical protein